LGTQELTAQDEPFHTKDESYVTVSLCGVAGPPLFEQVMVAVQDVPLGIDKEPLGEADKA
jgi:hypothetical protein